jgi:hypothetical protein
MNVEELQNHLDMLLKLSHVSDNLNHDDLQSQDNNYAFFVSNYAVRQQATNISTPAGKHSFLKTM